MSVLNVLAYPPVLKGLIVLVCAAAVFPITGVWIIRLNLLPYRFMLMHGALLGGALALIMNISPLPVVIAVSLTLLLLADLLTVRAQLDAGLSTMFLMVAALGGAMALVYSAKVPAQNTLGLLWGSLFAVSRAETAATVVFCGGLFLFWRALHLSIQALIFDREVARSAGINDERIMRILLVVTALTIAFAARILGALLTDALIILPAVIASVKARSLAALYRNAILLGLILGLLGFLGALAVDLPVGACVALLGAFGLGFALLWKQGKS